jgi:hypothetical protein
MMLHVPWTDAQDTAYHQLMRDLCSIDNRLEMLNNGLPVAVDTKLPSEITPQVTPSFVFSPNVAVSAGRFPVAPAEKLEQAISIAKAPVTSADFSVCGYDYYKELYATTGSEEAFAKMLNCVTME